MYGLRQDIKCWQMPVAEPEIHGSVKGKKNITVNV